jgi:TonB-dependent receptor
MSKLIRLIAALAVILAMGIVPSLQAQNAKGSVSGHVMDPTGAILQGAQVELQPTGTTVASNGQGAYLINSLPPGTYTITVTYVGFSLFTKVVNVTAGQVSTVDVQMEVSSQNDQVLVTAGRGSAEAEAINRERTADNILQVLPAEVIMSLPNANMADAIGRLPSVTLERDEGEGKYVQIRGTEPRLTNTSIDGINVASPESGVRQIKLDTIPADLVESVEINKTLQANMNADGIGGSVNLITKTAGERPTVALSGIGGYTPITNGRGVVETTGTIGQRFGSSKKLGVLVGGSYDWNGRGIDDIEPVPDLAVLSNGSSARYFGSIDQREYQYYRSRWGIAGTMDYQLKPDSNIYIKGLYSDFRNFGSRWVYSLTDNTQGIQTLNGNGCATDDSGVTVAPCTGVPSFNTQIRRPDFAIWSVVLGGKHVFTSSWLAWDASVGRSRQLQPGGDPSASFSATNLETSNCQYNLPGTTSEYLPQWTQSCYNEAYNPANFTLSSVDTLSAGKTAQLNLQGSGAYAKRYHLGSHLSTVEFGGRFRNAHKYDDSYGVTATPNDSVSMTLFPSQFSNSNYYNGAYPLGPNPNYQSVLAYYNANPAQFSLDSTQGGNSGNYDLVEQVAAGYVMNTIDFSRFQLIVGVRVESTNLRTVSWDFGGPNGNDPPPGLNFKQNGSYINVLPSASLKYILNSNTNIRAVFSEGLARPDPQDIAQALSYTFVSPTSEKNTASLGNPNLKAELAYNGDVLFEHYLNPFGKIEAGFFYKSLIDPIVTESFTETNFTPAPGKTGTYLVTQPINAGSGWVYGFEASYIQHLTFLPGLLRGLGISANYGYTNSQANGLPGRSDHPRLLRSAPNTWNISPTYDLGPLSVRAGFSYNGANIYSYQYQDGTNGADVTAGGLHGPNGDTYFYPHLQIDVQGSLRLSHGFTFISYVLNTNNEVFGFYNGSSQYMIQREYYKPTFALGMRWSPVHER